MTLMRLFIIGRIFFFIRFGGRVPRSNNLDLVRDEEFGSDSDSTAPRHGTAIATFIAKNRHFGDEHGSDSDSDSDYEE